MLERKNLKSQSQGVFLVRYRRTYILKKGDWDIKEKLWELLDFFEEKESEL